jgi:GT2 family glycosyltransferase
MSGSPALDIVIVSHQCRDLLAACLRSIEQHPYAGGATAVTVVDNASRDGTDELVLREFPTVAFVPLPDNRGFSQANNVALRDCRAERVLLLNPDTEVWAGVLDDMVAFLDAHPRAGIAGCRLLRRDGSFDHAAKRSFPSISDAVRHFSHAGRSDHYLAAHVAEDGVGAVDAVNGAFMLVRRAALDEVGLLDGGFFMYGEDLDWCYRAKRAGWDVLYNGEVSTLHVKSGSAGSQRGLRQNWAFHGAMGRFYRKHHAGRHALLDLVVYTAIVAKFGASAVGSAIARGIR